MRSRKTACSIVIKLAHQACRQLGIANPRIGVAGLNPHASDGGLFGFEEREQIIPAIEAARVLGINAEGPQPPDTFFRQGFQRALRYLRRHVSRPGGTFP